MATLTAGTTRHCATDKVNVNIAKQHSYQLCVLTLPFSKLHHVKFVPYENYGN